MRTTSICPKCASKEIATIPSQLGTYNVVKVGMFGFANLTRYICMSCGYLEQYVADEKSLHALQRKHKM